MSKTVGWAVGGAIVSITLGVLVGLVLHTGQTQRATPLPSAASSPSPRVTETGEHAGPTNTTQGEPRPSVTVTTSTTPSTSMTLSTGTAPSSSSPPPSPPSSSPRVTETGEYAGPTNTTREGEPGGDAAGGPCPKLAAKSSDADGTTLYCQVDQDDRVLRWRAVVDKGGCLSQSMTGVGADGLEYRCRLDDSGLNHWALAG
jgi:hypothetical protein